MIDSQVNASHLRIALEAAHTPPSDGTVDYTIATSLGAGYLARDRAGTPTFLIPLREVPAAVGRRGGGFSLSLAPCVAFTYGDRRWEQAAATFVCTEVGLVDTFLVLVLDLARRLESSHVEASWPTILRWVEEWQTLLSRRAAMTPEQQLGLWGELWFISKSADPDSLIAAWRGPELDAVDFFFDGAGLEVKVSRRAHVHHVSQRQVERPVGAHSAYLLSVWIAPEPARGISLAELVDTLVAKVSDPIALLKQIALLGYSPQDRDQFATPYVVLAAPLWFNATDIPQIRAVDPGITQIRYVVSLDPDKSLDIDVGTNLWRHFCQAEPPFSTKPIGTR